ncbi:hypothetical protein SDC9_205479 [bioreactor metagenome]|uniref:Uncharacterized protein n=1 Tax=bioreactor metagenome TaxID=1076179 RepID=A0A645J267_9ZZZZ
MGIAVEVLRLQSAVAHDFQNVGAVLALWYDVVLAYRFADDLANRHPRRKARIRILKDHLHLGAHPPQVLSGYFCEVFAVEENRSVGNVVQAQNRASYSRFAAAALADEPHRGAAFNFERNAVNRFDECLCLTED